MTPEQLTAEMQALWAAVMPPAAGPLDDYMLFVWMSDNPVEDIQMAITNTGGKMTRNVANGVAIDAKDAEKYASSILHHRRAWRRELARRRAASAAAKEQRLGGQQ